MQRQWGKTACILCESNCGIEVSVTRRRLDRVRGNKEHVGSKGYICEKAFRLDYYQNNAARLRTPLRRRGDGSYEEVSWEVAVQEVAAALRAVRDTHGGESIFYYGGGGQGNHLGGIYGSALRSALGSVYRSNAIAQEKTGEAFVDGRLYRGHTRGDFERTEVAVFVGKNPWISHGIPYARRTLKEIANDPSRSLVVLDPRRTETAEMADHFLQVKPGTDAFCIAAILALIVREGVHDAAFLQDHTTGSEAVLEVVANVPIDDFVARCGVDRSQLEEVANLVGTAASVSVLEDLGVEQAPHSTLVSYLQKLIWILTGSFAKPGGMALHTVFAPVAAGGGARRSRTTPVTGARIIAGLIPANSIADEILTDHPERFRAMIVESSNPAHSLAGSGRFAEAMTALDFSVVIDVALTETARQATYVLPAATQYEKPEAVFFNHEFPENVFFLRKPVLPPDQGTLPEAEIHTRLIEELGTFSDDDLAPLRRAASRGRVEFADAFRAASAENRQLRSVGAAVLYRTLGETLPEGLAGAAPLWFVAHQVAANYPAAVQDAGIVDRGSGLGDALFDAIIESDDGVVFTSHHYRGAFSLIGHDDKKIHLAIDELIADFAALADAPVGYTSEEFPFVLSAGERRSFTANTIFRDPEWRKKDDQGALRICPDDAAHLGVAGGARIRVVTAVGAAETVVEITDTMQRGHVALPNGLGLDYADEVGTLHKTGVAVNALTSTDWRDHIALTPWHKHVPARLELIAGSLPSSKEQI